MSNAMDIDELLESTARDMENEKREKAAKGSDDRSRKDDRDRGDRSERSMTDRHSSRDHDRRRRDDSRPRSVKAGTDDERHKGRRDGRDRDHDRYRDRSRDRHRRRDDRRGGGDYYNPNGRARSRSPRRPREDRYRGDRDRSRERRPRRDEERPRTAGRTATPEEPTEDDRDKRTIFVQQISQRAETRHLRAFFEAVGPVVEAQIVKDRVTGRSKG